MKSDLMWEQAIIGPTVTQCVERNTEKNGNGYRPMHDVLHSTTAATLLGARTTACSIEKRFVGSK